MDSAPTSSANPSPQSVQPLHHPGQEAVVEKPAGLDSSSNGQSAMNGNTFLAKKLAAKGQAFVSPSDALVSPCTAKLHTSKKKHFTKGKPLSLSNRFSQEVDASDKTSAPAEGSENVQLNAEPF